MSVILLDSSVIFDHLNERFGRTEFLQTLMDQGSVFACCAVNFTEVYAGLRPGEEDRTSAFMNSLEYLPVTSQVAKQAGLLRRDWQKKGKTLSYTDVTIAAIALSNEVPLLTDNQKHFPMPDLQLLALPERDRSPRPQ
jgi:predicted nucleic acid-binding protein